MPVSDELIGRNLARMRGDMSQKELAARMKERGWKWSQATVWSIEKGERPLRLAESEDVRAILGTLWSLTMEDADTGVIARNRRMYEANEALKAAVEVWLEEQLQLDVAVNHGGDVSPKVVEVVSGWLSDSPEEVAKAVRREREFAAQAQDERLNALGEPDVEHPEAP